MALIIETRKRSLVKSVVWRILGIFLLGGLAWLFTRSWEETTLITVIFHVIRFVLYYYHERVWQHIGWGRQKVEEDYMI